MTYYIVWAVESDGLITYQPEFVYFKEMNEETLALLLADRAKERNADKATIIFITKLPV